MDPSNELLSQLKGLAIPTEPGLGIAPGWLILAGLILALLVLALWYWLRRPAKAPDWRPAARAELNRLQALLPEASASTFLPQCSTLLRRIALAREPRSQIAAIHGEAWLQKLDGLSNSTLFSQGPGRLLLTGPYQSADSIDHTISSSELSELLNAAETLFNRSEARER